MQKWTGCEFRKVQFNFWKFQDAFLTLSRHVGLYVQMLVVNGLDMANGAVIIPVCFQLLTLARLALFVCRLQHGIASP